MLTVLIFVIAGTRQNAGGRRQRPQREVRSRYMVPNANVEHAAAAAEDEAGFGEELDVEPSTTSGGRPPSGRRTSSRRLF